MRGNRRKVKEEKTKGMEKERKERGGREGSKFVTGLCEQA